MPYNWTDIAATGTRIAFNTQDDASRYVSVSIALHRLQYRVGQAGAWRDWLAAPATWDFTTGEAPPLVWSFGAGQPIVLRLGETYCFRSQAADSAGNVEPAHAAADTCTQFAAPAYTCLPLIVRRSP